MLSTWITGVCTSLLAALLLPILLTFANRKFRTTIIRTLLRLSGAGVYEYFPTQKAASAIIVSCFNRAKEIRILGVRAWSVFPVVAEFSQLGEFIRQKGADCKVRILLLSPFIKESSATTSFMTKRESELKQIQPRDAAGLALADQVVMTLNVLTALNKEGFNCSVHLYNELPIFKLFLFDDDAFVGGFNRANVGRNNPVYHVRRNEGLLFDLADRHFEYLWNFRSSEYCLNAQQPDHKQDNQISPPTSK